MKSNKDLTKEELIEKLTILEERFEKQKQTAIKYLQENQEVRLYNSCKANAKRKGVEFNITLEDIVLPERCPYFDCVLTNISGEGRVQTNASIDRIDSSKGYIKGNIQILSDLANRMKQEATVEQLVTFAKGVLRNHAS